MAAKKKVPEPKRDVLKKEEFVEDENVLGLKINNQKILIFLLVIISLILIFSLLFNIYLLFFKKEKECPKCDNITEQIIVSEKYISYNGQTFKIPEDWNFVSSDNSYKLTNEKKNLEIELLVEKTKYEEFISEEYLKQYLQDLQVNKNIKISSNKEIKNDTLSYYFIEGIKDSYYYNRIILYTSDNMTMIDVMYENEVVYNDLKDEIIEFASSYVKNNT